MVSYLGHVVIQVYERIFRIQDTLKNYAKCPQNQEREELT